jgi:hypothetical protein
MRLSQYQRPSVSTFAAALQSLRESYVGTSGSKRAAEISALATLLCSLISKPQGSP